MSIISLLSTFYSITTLIFTQVPVTPGARQSWWKNSALNDLARATEVRCLKHLFCLERSSFCYFLRPVARNAGKVKHTGCVVGGTGVNWGCVGGNLASRSRQRWVTVRKLKVKSWRYSLCTILIHYNKDKQKFVYYPRVKCYFRSG